MVIFHSCVGLPEGKYGNFANGDISFYLTGLRCCEKSWVAAAVYSNSSHLCGILSQLLTMRRYLRQHPQNQDFCMKPPEHTHIIYICVCVHLHTSMTVYIQYPVFTSNKHVMKGLFKLCKEKHVWVMCLLFTFFWSFLASNMWYRNRHW